MGILTFNSKHVGTTNGIVTFGGSPTPGSQNTYFKLDITALQSGSIMQLSELEFYDENNQKLNVIYVAGTPGTSSDFGDENPPNMFDGRTDTKWCVRNSSEFVIGKAYGVVTASKYRIATASDSATWTGRNPKTWTISRAVSTTDITDRSSASWTVIDTRTNDTTMTNVNETFFDFTIPQPAQQNLLMSAGTTRGGLKSTGKSNTLLGAKGTTSSTAKSDDAVWNAQEEPSLGSGGY